MSDDCADLVLSVRVVTSIVEGWEVPVNLLMRNSVILFGVRPITQDSFRIGLIM